MAVKGFPSVYESDPYKYTSFDCVDFDIDNEGNMYLGFQADSSIYVLIKNSGRSLLLAWLDQRWIYHIIRFKPSRIFRFSWRTLRPKVIIPG